MVIDVTCGACNRKLKAPETMLGKVAKCPGCGAPVQVKSPASPEEVVPLVPVASDTTSDWQKTATDVSHAAIGKTKEAISDTGAALRILLANPAQGASEAYHKLGKSKALQVAICCLILFDSSILFCYYRLSRNDEATSITRNIFGRISHDLPISFYLKLAVVAAVPLLALAGAMLVIRSIARGIGAWQSDMFVSGFALVPFAIVILASNILGIGNVGLIMVLYLVAACLFVLILFHGFRDLCGLAPGFASYATPGAIVLSVYLTKVILVSLMTP